MGCDIHAMIERKHTSPYGTIYWVNSGDPLIERDYRIFGALAGVRDSSVPAIQDGRGLPGLTDYRDDLSDAFKSWLKEWDSDAHSAGYVTLREVIDYDASRLRDRFGIGSWDDLRAALQDVADRHQLGPDEVRLVFFFDN